MKATQLTLVLALTQLVCAARVASAGYASAVLANSPSAFYQFTETSGTTAVDSSGNGNNATYVPPVALNQPKPNSFLAPSITLPGAGPGGYLSVPSSAVGDWASNTGTSFEVWFKTTSSGVILGQNIAGGTVDGGSPGGFVPGLYVGTNGLLYSELFWKGGIAPEVSTSSVADGKWHDAAVVFNAGTETLYLDGAPIASHTSVAQSGYSGSYDYYLGVGYDSTWTHANGGWDHFNGSIADASFYQTALTPGDVTAHFLAGTTPEPSSFVLGGLGVVGLLIAARRRRKV